LSTMAVRIPRGNKYVLLQKMIRVCVEYHCRVTLDTKWLLLADVIMREETLSYQWTQIFKIRQRLCLS